jgi:hypothetical protein
MMTLEGSCRCGAVRFSVESHAPHPYQLCYCSICRKTAGGGGYAINLSAEADTLKVEGADAVRVYRAELIDEGGEPTTSSGERNFCTRCATALWLFDATWPTLIHPFASAIDTALPVPPARTHIMLRFKATWVVPDIGPEDVSHDLYPDESIEHWHRARGLWLD